MVPDTITFVSSLPATSTDKVDYQRLGAMAADHDKGQNVNQLLRRVFCWKFVFFELFLPLLRILGPSRSDAVLRRLGQILTLVWPGRRARLRNALMRVRDALDLDGPIEDLWPELAANMARFLARDYPLDSRWDERVFERFEVLGYEQLERAIAAGGASSSSAATWGPTSPGCTGCSARAARPCPGPAPLACLAQALLAGSTTPRALMPRPRCSLRRGLPPADAIELLIRARAALRDGLARLPLRRHPLARTQHTARTAAGPGTTISGHLDRAWPSSPGHPFSTSSAPIFPAAGSGSSSRLWAGSTPARRARPWPTISNSSKPGSPPSPPRPSPTCSGPVSIVPSRIIPSRDRARPGHDASQPPECGVCALRMTGGERRPGHRLFMGFRPR